MQPNRFFFAEKFPHGLKFAGLDFETGSTNSLTSGGRDLFFLTIYGQIWAEMTELEVGRGYPRMDFLKFRKIADFSGWGV